MSDPVPEDQQEQNLPTNPEDRKAAAALSSLNNTNDEASKLPSRDQEALGKAMSRLEIAAGQSSGNGVAGAKKTSTTQAETGAGAAAAAAEVKKKASVKVSAEDIGLLVEALDLNKAKATELLKVHDGDARRAIRAFIAVGV